MEKTVSKLITSGTVEGYNLSIVKMVLGTDEVYSLNIRQNEDSSVEILHNAVLPVNNLEDIKFRISVPSKDLKITEIDRHVKELKDAEFAVAMFNNYIQLTK